MSTPITPLGKEETIARLLKEGNTPAALVAQGYARGTVYKVARRLRVGNIAVGQSQGTESGAILVASEPSVEADPEIVELKKKVRKAQLERTLREVNGPSELDVRLSALEHKLEELETFLEETAGEAELLAQELNATPLRSLRGRFNCACGAKGLVAVRVECTECGRETRYGWWPNKNR